MKAKPAHSSHSFRPAGRPTLGLAAAHTVGVAASVALAFVLACIAVASAQVATDISQCRSIDDPMARLRCYESLAPPEVKMPPSPGLGTGFSAAQTIGSWRLVRTPNPRGGKEAVSITRPGDLSGSDPDFVGLMIRCAEPDIEVLLVMLRPLSFRSRPRVSINGTKYESSVAPPGLNILLPRDVAELAGYRWATLSHLSLEVDDAGTITKGLVPLDGFDPALKSLNAACFLRQ